MAEKQYDPEARMDAVPPAQYAKHVEAMTAEDLRAKWEIAAELAWRDTIIEGLLQEIQQLKTRHVDE